MYQFEKDALIRKIAERKKAGSKKSLPILAREAVRGAGITYPPDVRRLANEICAVLGEHGRETQAAARARRRRNRRAEF